MMKTALAAIMGASVLVQGGAFAATLSRAPFGKTPDGSQVEAITLSNGRGVSARVITYGASLQSLIMPDAKGQAADVVLGYSNLKAYIDKPQYFGATVGRVANRIARGRFSLDGKTYQIPLNDGVNSLHGGPKGFDKVNWKIEATHEGPDASVTLSYDSPNGEMGYPGNLHVTATYSLDEKNHLAIIYKATTDAPTVVNLSNHTYWNLAGEGTARSINDDVLTIAADAFTPVDATLIPTGEIRPVEGTIFDFRKGMAIGAHVRDAQDEQIGFGRGYDLNWVISRSKAKAARLVASVSDPVSGRRIDLWSDQPGLQFYSGNFLDGTSSGKSGHAYREGDAFVLEPQGFPDTVNHPSFGSARLDPGQTYSNTIVYRLCTTSGSCS